MKTYEKCLLCFEQQAVNACEISGLSPDEQKIIGDAVKARIKTFPVDSSPIRMAVDIHQLVRERSSIADPYLSIKEESNRVCKGCVSIMRQIMSASLTKLETAVKLAITGNIIDSGVYKMREIRRRDLFLAINETLKTSLKGSSISEFEQAIRKTENILYIADNAGECFFDIPLLALLEDKHVVYAVRGGPILNDATMEDACAAGIHEKYRLIDTGDNAPGILLDRCSEDFRKVYESSDLIISKGQGNYESLSTAKGKKIVFILKVKCDVITKDIGYGLGSNVMKVLEG